jgi:acetyl esterase
MSPLSATKRFRPVLRRKQMTRAVLFAAVACFGGFKLRAATSESFETSPLVAAPDPKAVDNKKAPEVTPLSLPGSEPFVFRRVGEFELRLHVVKPEGWTKDIRRPCLVGFFGGGWNTGTPANSIMWARWAASCGLVGIAPDYRTRDRHGSFPEDSVSDGRAAVRWIVAHADELGIDRKRIICLGGSAGAHVAAWTAIPKPGPGKDDPAPEILPVALLLVNPVTDTTPGGGYWRPERFGNDAARARASSVPDQMPEHMPPTIVFHATADKTVPYATSVAFRDLLIRRGNRCELVTFQGLGHSYYSSTFGAEGRAALEMTKKDGAAFLASLGLIPSTGASER